MMHGERAALALLLVACGEARVGENLFVTNCVTCHATGAAGALGPNITFSTTAGIGGWTQAELLTTLRTGVNKDGRTLCASMTRFTQSQLSDTDIGTIYAYLRTLKDDTTNRGMSCP